MLSYVIRRLLLMIPTLIGITALVFFVMNLTPGGVAGAMISASGAMRPAEREAREAYLNKRFGLDRPAPVQYGRWLNRVSPIGFQTYQEDDPEVIAAAKEIEPQVSALPPGAKKPRPRVSPGDIRFDRWPERKSPDLGTSFLKNRPVLELVKERLPITLLLNLMTIPIAYAIAVTTGIYAARHRGKTVDVLSGTTFLALWSIPTMWTGVMAIGFLASKDYLGWFPTGGLSDLQADAWRFFPAWADGTFQRGWLLDRLWHLALPIACLVYTEFAFLSKLMRSSTLENLSADFARTARAKGLSENVVLFRHVLSNSILPLITVAATTIPALLGGSVVIESIFSINGMGRLMIEAIQTRDQEIVLSVTLVVGAVTVISLLIADLCYALADPRITYS
jgi:ABC-type dipeptide/oligopeptide/nickel transport system permease component